MFSKCKVSSDCIKRIFATIPSGRCVRGWDPKIENQKGGFEIKAKRTGHPTKRRTGSAQDTKRRPSTFQRFSNGDFVGDSVKRGCGRRMRTADGQEKKDKKIKKKILKIIKKSDMKNY